MLISLVSFSFVRAQHLTISFLYVKEVMHPQEEFLYYNTHGTEKQQV